ncbi:hypothetical protein, partial [Tahibacter caeni]|uniref:hypothetical protein n=1 Tax=Tahibacter caeni TaxID=1453545 RepID=UPI002148CC96
VGTRVADGAAQAGANVSRAARKAVDTVESRARTARTRQPRDTRGGELRDAAAGFRASVAAGAEDVAERIDDGIDAVADDLRDVDDDGRAAWTQATDAVREVSRDALASTAERLVEAGGKVRDYVRTRPLSALGVPAPRASRSR